MQTADHKDENENQPPPAPPGLVAAFSRLPQERIFVPRTIDEAVMREARKHLAKPERPSFHWRRLVPRFAAAAILLALLTYLTLRHSSNSRPPTFAREDLNHDGRVDILDAFALARQLKAGQATAPSQDANGDGVVDQRDVETIAAQAVRLEKGGHS